MRAASQTSSPPSSHRRHSNTRAASRTMSAHARDITLNVDAPYVDVRRFVDAGDAQASTVVITIPLRASSRRLERALDEPIGKSFDRLRAGIAKSTKSAPKERLSVELFALDGSRVDDAATHVDAWNDDYALAVGDEWFRVRLDAPEIAGVTTVGLARVRTTAAGVSRRRDVLSSGRRRRVRLVRHRRRRRHRARSVHQSHIYTDFRRHRGEISRRRASERWRAAAIRAEPPRTRH